MTDVLVDRELLNDTADALDRASRMGGGTHSMLGDKLRAALDAKPVEPVAFVPDGWQLVPKVAATHPLHDNKHNDTNTYDLGRCRRHAPSMGGYPVVMVNDWCGDHRLDENKFRAG